MNKMIFHNQFLVRSLLAVVLLSSVYSCERDLSDDAVVAGNSEDPTVFIDTFTSGLDYFPFAGTFAEAFSVETDQVNVFAGAASMRLDIPNVGDPNGAFAGAIFRTTDVRDLRQYDALTFYAKASSAATLNEVGFGQDFFGNEFQATVNGLRLTTNWRKYTVPLPDPSKLEAVAGLFWYAEGPEDGDGYSIWIDEIQYERLGTVAQPRPVINNGEIAERETFIGSGFSIDGLNVTFNLADGQDITVNAAPAYFNFESSDESIATVDENGFVQVIGMSPIDPITMQPEVVTITATLGTDDNGDPRQAAGEIRVVSLGDFTPAPTPTRDPANVISVFSDAYTNVPVDYFNGFFQPFQTTQGGAPPLEINGDRVINYTDLNFVGIGTFLNVPSVNITSMTHLHIDINVQESIDPGDFIDIELINQVGGNETSGRVRIPASDLSTNNWEGFDLPLAQFSGLTVRDEVGLILFISDATISNILVDNIYYYKDVVQPTPIVDDSANTQVELPVGYESTTLTYPLTSFAGAASQIIPNPDTTGINNSSRVLETLKSNGADFFAGTFLDLATPIDFSTSQTMRMKVWSPKANIPVRLALETSGGANQVFVDATVLDSNEWTELEFDFSGVFNPAVTYQRVVIFFEFIPGTPGDGSIYYSDDIKVIP